jgi:hypothetical protein
VRAPDLRAEAEALKRPCVYLVDAGEEYAAVWGGAAVVPSPGREYRHWISIDTRFMFPSRRGCLSVFANEEDCKSGAVRFEADALLPSSSARKRLFARPSASLPPIDAVFRFGSPDVRAWLQALGWDPMVEYTDNFPDPEPVKAYEADYQAQLPLYSGGAHAVIGGWHFPWPDGDWADLIDCNLLVWTFEDCEPWIEAWSDGSREWVFQRIT